MSEIRRSAPAFTEGLVFRDGFLFESGGGYGSSSFNRIQPETGEVDVLARLPGPQFGEGLEASAAHDTASGRVFHQLTWKENRVLSWSESGAFLGDAVYPYEGWGLTRDESGSWIASDGSSTLRFFNENPAPRDHKPWKADHEIQVVWKDHPLAQLNELEFSQGLVWANVYKTNRVVSIHPGNGCVMGVVDLGSLAAASGIDFARNSEAVLNGIAYRADRGTFYVTGKNWPMIHEIRISRSPGAHGEREPPS